MSKNRVVIAGGGTGGHIYPGFALAEYLKKQDPSVEVHFVGSQGGLEEKIVPKQGYPLHLLPIGRLHHSVSLWRRIKALFLLPWSFVTALWLYLKLRPRWVLGVGGFASGPFVFVASILGGRTALLEPNAYPGLANRWLSKLVTHCFVVFEDAAKYFPSHKVVQVGLPVRLSKSHDLVSYKGDRPLRVLIFGGSQGARAINNVVGEWLEHNPQLADDLEILHQIGHRDFPQWKAKYDKGKPSALTYVEYIHNMPEKLQWADLVICRSGVGSVAEVAMANRPAIFIPLPTSADNHQVKNAQVLANKKAALMIEEKDLSWQKLNEQVLQLKSHPDQLVAMAENLKDIDYSSAPEQIINRIQKG